MSASSNPFAAPLTRFLCTLKSTLALSVSLLIVIVIFAMQALAAGTLDPTFGINGEADGSGTAFALQPDGKIVSVDAIGAISEFDFVVRRYNANGSPDNSFGTSGQVVTAVTPLSDLATSIAIQPDGKIVVGGYTTSILPPTGYLILARYNSDGSLDASFGAGGIVLTPRTIGQTIKGIALQPDGKIVAVGRGATPPLLGDCVQSFMVARYSTTGILDRSFGSGLGGRGIVLAALTVFTQPYFCMGNPELSSVSLTQDGKILVGGVGLHYTALRGQFVIGQFSSTGEREFLRSYNNGRDDSLGGGFKFVHRLPDGKIIAIGTKIARLLASGELDPTFLLNNQLGVGGNSLFDGGGAILPDGKIVRYTLVIPAAPPNTYTVTLSNKNGGTVGSIITVSQLYEKIVRAVLAQPDGKVIVISDKMRRYLTISDLAGKQSDFDGDTKTDIGYFRPADGTWSIRQSKGGSQTVAFGVAGDYITPGRYLGGNSIVAVYRPAISTWFLNSVCGTQLCSSVFGEAGAIPVGGSYDGDGWDDFAVFKDGKWRVQQSSDNQERIAQWGTLGDKPVPGDYDYDGFTDLAVYRPATGTWYVLLSSSGGVLTRQFGNSTDQPVPGDFDGDGRTDFAVFRP